MADVSYFVYMTFCWLIGTQISLERTLRGHKGSILSLAVDDNGDWLLSGGECELS